MNTNSEQQQAEQSIKKPTKCNIPRTWACRLDDFDKEYICHEQTKTEQSIKKPTKCNIPRTCACRLDI